MIKSLFFIFFFPVLLLAEIICPYCKHKNEDDAKACSGCGKWLYVLLEVKSEPSHAEVYLNNKVIGYTPLKQNVLVGKYDMRIYKMGYVPVEETIDFLYQTQTDELRTIEKNYSLVFKRELDKNQGRFYFDSQPQKADLHLDGYSIGNTPSVSKMLDPGKHKIKFILEPYETYETTVKLESGVEQDVFHIFVPKKQKKSGFVKIMKYGGATIFLTGVGFALGAESNYKKYTNAQQVDEIKEYWDKYQSLRNPAFVFIGFGLASFGTSFFLK